MFGEYFVGGKVTPLAAGKREWYWLSARREKGKEI